MKFDLPLVEIRNLDLNFSIGADNKTRAHTFTNIVQFFLLPCLHVIAPRRKRVEWFLTRLILTLSVLFFSTFAFTFLPLPLLLLAHQIICANKSKSKGKGRNLTGRECFIFIIIIVAAAVSSWCECYSMKAILSFEYLICTSNKSAVQHANKD